MQILILIFKALLRIVVWNNDLFRLSDKSFPHNLFFMRELPIEMYPYFNELHTPSKGFVDCFSLIQSRHTCGKLYILHDHTH